MFKGWTCISLVMEFGSLNGDLGVNQNLDPKKRSTALIWNYDIYGFNSGRTREYCDLFAENGFLVLLPDYFRGEVFPEELNDQGEFTCRMTDWARLSKDLDGVGKGSKLTFVRLFKNSNEIF